MTNTETNTTQVYILNGSPKKTEILQGCAKTLKKV